MPDRVFSQASVLLKDKKCHTYPEFIYVLSYRMLTIRERMNEQEEKKHSVRDLLYILTLKMAMQGLKRMFFASTSLEFQ